MSNFRYGIVFSTSENNHYYYDSGTGKVIQCNTKENNMIEKILNDKMSLEQAKRMDLDFADFISKEKLFECPEHREFILPSRKEFQTKVKNQCEQIILELTENCDLRCGYCIYNEHHPKYRSFSKRNMTFEIAKKSIDYVMSQFSGDKFALTFYGGEPLMNYDVMKKCIDYTLKNYCQYKISVSFTTNLTLLTEEMAKYFGQCRLDKTQSAVVTKPMSFR